MALSLDGSAHANATAASPTISLTTSAAGVVCVLVTTNGGPLTSASGSTLGSFTRVGRSSSGSFPIELWYVISSGAVSSETITVNNTASGYTTIDAFGISGTPSSSVLDANASNPSTNTDASTLTISTDTADTFICGGYRVVVENPTQGTGYTLISGAHFQLCQYKIVSSTQSSLAFGIGTGDTFQNGGIVAAFVQDAGGGIVVGSGLLTGLKLNRLRLVA